MKKKLIICIFLIMIVLTFSILLINDTKKEYLNENKEAKTINKREEEKIENVVSDEIRLGDVLTNTQTVEVKDDDKVNYEKSIDNFCKLIESNSNDIGEKYLCQVSNEESYNFYLLNDNGDNTVTLLMANNLGEKTSWNNLYNYLKEKTSSWTITSDIGIPSVTQIGCASNETLYIENSEYCNNLISNWAQGVYWTSTQHSNGADAFYVIDDKVFFGNKSGTVCWSDSNCEKELYGLRPIIIISKNKLIK